MENIHGMFIDPTIRQFVWEERGLTEFPISSRNGHVIEDIRIPVHITTAVNAILKNQSPKNITQPKISSTAWHPRVLMLSLLGETSQSTTLGRGGFGCVSKVCLTGLVPDELELDKLCVKCTEAVESDLWHKILDQQCLSVNNLCNIMDPVTNSAISESIILQIASLCWHTGFVPKLIATWCEDPQYILHCCSDINSKALSTSNSTTTTPPISKTRIQSTDTITSYTTRTPPRLYMWTSCFDDEINANWREDSSLPLYNYIMKLESIVAQAAVGTVALSDIGITHNDLHVGNLMYTYTLEFNPMQVKIPCGDGSQNSDTILEIPVYDGKKVHVIDFGLSSIHLKHMDITIGGTYAQECGLSPCRGLDIDLRTLALDLLVTSRKVIHQLFMNKLPPIGLIETCTYENEKQQLIRGWRFLHAFLNMTLSIGEDRNILQVFKNNKTLRKLASSVSITVRFKDLKTLRAKYHIVRNILFCKNADCLNIPRLTRDTIITLLSTYYSEANNTSDVATSHEN